MREGGRVRGGGGGCETAVKVRSDCIHSSWSGDL